MSVKDKEKDMSLPTHHWHQYFVGLPNNMVLSAYRSPRKSSNFLSTMGSQQRSSDYMNIYTTIPIIENYCLFIYYYNPIYSDTQTYVATLQPDAHNSNYI